MRTVQTLCSLMTSVMVLLLISQLEGYHCADSLLNDGFGVVKSNAWTKTLNWVGWMVKHGQKLIHLISAPHINFTSPD